MASGIAEAALSAKGDLDKLAKAKFPGGSATVADTIKEMIGTIGENMTLRRTAYLAVKKGAVASYMHNAMAPGLGKIGVIVALEFDRRRRGASRAFGRQVAMHIAAANPQASTSTASTRPLIERERAVLTEQAKESGKPAQVIEKMVEGRLRKFYEEVVLLAQAFVHDPETTVAKAVAAAEQGGRRADQDHGFPPVCAWARGSTARKPISRRRLPRRHRNLRVEPCRGRYPRALATRHRAGV